MTDETILDTPDDPPEDDAPETDPATLPDEVADGDIAEQEAEEPKE